MVKAVPVLVRSAQDTVLLDAVNLPVRSDGDGSITSAAKLVLGIFKEGFGGNGGMARLPLDCGSGASSLDSGCVGKVNEPLVGVVCSVPVSKGDASSVVGLLVSRFGSPDAGGVATE